MVKTDIRVDHTMRRQIMEQIIYLWIGLGYLALAASHSSPGHPQEPAGGTVYVETEAAKSSSEPTERL